MLAVTRFRVPTDPAEVAGFTARAERAVAALADQTGFCSADLGRNLDDEGLWVLLTRWRDVGSYRRALSASVVKVEAWPLFTLAVDEPSAFEPLLSR